MTFLARPVLLLLVALGASACGAGDDVVDRAELEEQVQAQLSETVGEQAPKAVCPDELKAEVDASTRCHMDFPERKRLGITVKVKSKDGDRVRFDIAADEQLGETPQS